jgi:adenine phosphoribosyltransferase
MSDAEWLKRHVRDLPDYPKPGVTFRDITPLLGRPGALSAAVEHLCAPFRDEPIDKVVAVEARGFLFGAPVATVLGAGFVPVRKPGKLPWNTHGEEYELEYGTDRLEIHQDAIGPGERVLIVDDVLATGGTAAAAGRLVRQLDGTVAGYSFLIELTFLPGRERLAGHTVHAVVTY